MIHQAVINRFFRREEVIAVGIALDFFQWLTAVLGQ